MICTLTSQCKMVQLYLISYVRVLAIRPLNLPNIILFCASSPSNKEIQFIIDCILIKLGGSTCRNSAGGNLCGHRYLQRLLAHRVNNRKSSCQPKVTQDRYIVLLIIVQLISILLNILAEKYSAIERQKQRVQPLANFANESSNWLAPQ